MAGKLPGRALDPTTTITINNLSLGNSVVNSSVIAIGNSTVNTFVNSSLIAVGSNVTVNTSTIHLGNSTVNTVIHTTGFTGNGAGLHTVNAAALQGNSVNDILLAANTAANTLASAAYTNATSHADTKAGDAYTNAVAYAASNSYVNSTFLQLAGGTLTGNLVVNASANVVSNLAANNVTIRGDVQIDGNLVVSGTSVTINAASLAVEDNMIYLNNGSQVTHPDLGIAGNYNDGSYKHAGFFRDASDGIWKVFDGYTLEPDASAYIDTSNVTFRIADFQANAMFASNGTFAGPVSGITTLATGNTTITGLINVSTNTATFGTALYVVANGNVGINTASPTQLLDVNGNVIIRGIQGFNATNETATLFLGDGASYIQAVYDGGLDFYQNSTFRMRIQGGTGNVGIGNTAPTAKLQVDGTIKDSIGSVRTIQRTGSAKTSSYTLTTSDVGQFVEVGTGGSIVVPNSTFATGDVVSIFNNTSGNVTVTLNTTNAYIGGVDVNRTSVTLATRGIITILFLSGTLCIVNGNVS